MIWRVIESEVIPLCTNEGVGQIVWSPIAQGVLTGKYLPASALAAGCPEQVREKAQAAGVRLDPAVLRQIDEILGDQVITDPAYTTSPRQRP